MAPSGSKYFEIARLKWVEFHVDRFRIYRVLVCIFSCGTWTRLNRIKSNWINWGSLRMQMEIIEECREYHHVRKRCLYGVAVYYIIRKLRTKTIGLLLFRRRNVIRHNDVFALFIRVRLKLIWVRTIENFRFQGYFQCCIAPTNGISWKLRESWVQLTWMWTSCIYYKYLMEK